MKKEMIVRAWKDPEYRTSLSTEERAALPECPAGRSLTELHDDALAEAVGGLLQNSCVPNCRIHPTTTVVTLGNSTTRYYLTTFNPETL